MDATAYVAGKAAGVSGVTLHAPTTLLISCPPSPPFDALTGKPLPAVEQGFQIADIEAMITSAEQAVTSAQAALATAQTNLANAQTLLADCQAVLPAIVVPIAPA